MDRPYGLRVLSRPPRQRLRMACCRCAHHPLTNIRPIRSVVHITERGWRAYLPGRRCERGTSLVAPDCVV
jgi:hypothetical protein